MSNTVIITFEENELSYIVDFLQSRYQSLVSEAEENKNKPVYSNTYDDEFALVDDLIDKIDLAIEQKLIILGCSDN